MFRTRYLKAVQNSDPIVKIFFKGLITLFMKNSFPPNKKSSTCVHNIVLNLLSKCYINTIGADLQDLAPKFISSFLTFTYHSFETSVKLYVVVFNFDNLLWEP